MTATSSPKPSRRTGQTERQTPTPPTRTEEQWRTEIWRALAPIGHQGYGQAETFRIFVRMAFRALYGATLPKDSEAWAENEKDYMLAFRNTPKPTETANAACAALCVLIDALTAHATDVLGPLMMAADLGSAAAGQFFTPMCVSQMMADMTVHDAMVDEKPSWSILEPAAGSGGFLIALKQSFAARGVSPLRMRCEAWDIDERCVQMTYIQTTLLAIPCVVVHGNTLSQERWGTYPNACASPWFRGALLSLNLPTSVPEPVLTPPRPKRTPAVVG